MKIKVMLADDHQMFTDLLKVGFLQEPDIDVVGDVVSGKDLFALLDKVVPDILILDIDMVDMNGIDIAKIIGKKFPSIRIIALSGHAEMFYIKEMLEAGAQGYVVKSSGVETLISAIRKVSRGGNFLSSDIANALVRGFKVDSAATVPPSSSLGKREKEVLSLVCVGKSSLAIAQLLGIAEGTVEAHRRNIKQKLGIYSTAELTRYAIREGLIPS